MRVLIAGETSGRVRDAFLQKGHDAWSCDFLDTEVSGPHIKGDAFDCLEDGWDLMIAHPTCTKLTVAAAWTMYHPDDISLPLFNPRPHPSFPHRRREQDCAVADFLKFAQASIPRICIENPVGVISTFWRKPDQYIQPYYFGDDASKKTGLWLKGLLPLRINPSHRFNGRTVEWPPGSGRKSERWSNQTDSGQNKLGPSEDRWKKRSETYLGVAKAFADNWG